MSKHHIHPALADLYAKHPRNAVQLNAAYELGLGDLGEVLKRDSRRKRLTEPREVRCINDFPVQFVHILNTGIIARAFDLVLPHFYEAVSKDERRVLGGMAGTVKQFLNKAIDLLSKAGVFRATDDLTALQVGQGYTEDMADLLYECLHQMNSHEDPRAPHSAMVMFNELDMLAEVSDATDEPAQ